MKFPREFNVDNLDGKAGFTITAPNIGLATSVTKLCDMNGDGRPDMAIGSGLSTGINLAYVIFGANNFPANFDVSSLNGTNGFRLTSSSNGFGVSISGIGDLNDDGKCDLLLGTELGSDKAYVVYGANTFPTTFDTSSLNGINGFTLTSASQNFGRIVSGIGDINGDKKPDILISALSLFEANNGKVYVVFGAKQFPAVFDTASLNGQNGFTITSQSNTFGLGAAGIDDVNGDGKADFAVGAIGSNAVYVIFGASAFPAVLDTSSLYGNNGFTITAVNMPSYAFFGYSIDGIGDINDDDRLDFIIGSSGMNETACGRTACVIFGQSSFPVTLDIASLDGNNGFTLTSQDSAFGFGVAGLADINGDGLPDIGIGSGIGPNRSYVVFGARNFSRFIDTSSLNGENGFTLTSSIAPVGSSISGLGDVIDSHRANFILGACDPWFPPACTNKAYVIYGFGEDMRQNYGMLSQVKYFVPMNKTGNAGKLQIGSTGFWCKSDSLFIGDFNGDGRSDLLCSLDDGQNYMMLSHVTSNGIAFSPMGNDQNGQITIGNNDKWCIKSYQELLVGDFNNDGKSDLLCHNNQQINQGFTYVMLSTGNGFKPMADSQDGYVRVGRLGEFCPIGGRLLIGNFDGINGDDLLCNDRSAGNMIMVPQNTSFMPINSNVLGTVNLGIMKACTDVWCTRTGSVLMSGHFNNDNRSDLICNDGGQNEIMLASFKNDSSCSFQAINPANGNRQLNGWIPMGKDKWPIWCDATKTKLIVADIDGNNLDDLICNTAGAHEIQLCKSMGSDQYEFRSINAGNPSDSGRTKIANYDVWCNSQSISSGHFSDSGLDDLWCNQNYNPIGALADEN